MKKLIAICLCAVALACLGGVAGLADTGSDAWADIPAGVRDALEESLAEQTPVQWLESRYDMHSAALILSDGSVATLCALVREGEGVWRVLDTNNTLIQEKHASVDGLVGLGTQGRLGLWSPGDSDPIVTTLDYLFERGNDDALTLGFYRQLQGDGITFFYLMDAREDGYYILRKGSDGRLETMAYDMPDFSLHAIGPEGLNALLDEKLKARDDVAELPAQGGADMLPEPAVATLEGTWAQVFGVADGQALVHRNLSEGRNQFGYIAADTLPEGTPLAPLTFGTDAYVTTITLSLTDDPLRSGNTVETLPPGTEVTRLASLGTYWIYVEANLNGGVARGFVPGDFLVAKADAPETPDEVGALAEYYLSLYGEGESLDAEMVYRIFKLYTPEAPPMNIAKVAELVPTALRNSIEAILNEYGANIETLARLYRAEVSVYSYDAQIFTIYLSPIDINDSDLLPPYGVTLDVGSGSVLSTGSGTNG